VALAREILAGLERRLHAHAGFELPAWVVETRALARMSALDLEADAYLDLVSTPRGAAELRALVEAVRVGETRFFRHRPHVDALLEVVVPAWREREERSPRVWSAGCATGEEPYTLALVLARALPRPSFTPTILATDVSTEALAAARRGAYPAAAIESVPEAWRSGLISDGETVRLRPEIAALVTFKQQNLADADLPRGFDLVWCRNVLIYFGPEARKRVLEKLVAALEPGGFLFLGYSETLRDVAGLRAVRHADQILWQKAAPASLGRKPEQAATSARASVIPSAAPAAAPLAAPARLVRASGVPPQPAAPRSLPAPSTARPSAAPAAAPKAPKARSGARASLRIAAANPATLAAAISAALGAPGLASLTLDLDAADYLGDDVAPVLRRAAAAAEAAGIELLLRATRPGAQRWLRRNGLAEGNE
jgi:chemotaxis protein methyltransferase CheR